MELKNLQLNPENFTNKKLVNSSVQFKKIIVELNKKDLTEETNLIINDSIDKLNATLTSISEKKALTQLKKEQRKILHFVEKKHKIVAKKHYKEKYLFLCMAALSVPLAFVFWEFLHDMVLLAVFLTITLPICTGILIGTKMDQKAAEDERQLDVELS
ncbi:hypothetical protein [Mesonia aquimarina]|uniref:hypothetical protein n=1 Tax=Mesonia aquimarina TaxID=1504967 RepID=UPI000EF6117C|nr:hypothetical protein [Mesonia aquimarina]